jgi:fluoroacetyl-CoA thioesterase
MDTTPSASTSTSASATLHFTVTDDDTALAVGSGSLPVLGTPRLLAWCEAATCAAVEPSLADGETSVGTRVTLEHQGASPVGRLVEVTATTSYADGRLRRFSVAARHVEVGPEGPVPGKVVATGEITRVVVDAERFLGRISPAPADLGD